MKLLTFNLFGVKKASNYFAERLESLGEIVSTENADIVRLQGAHSEQVQEIVQQKRGGD